MNQAEILTGPVASSETEPVRTTAMVHTESEFDALEDTWSELVDQSSASVFLTFEWLRTWWTYFGKGRQLHCIVFKSNGHIVSIAPLFRERVRLFGMTVATRLQFLGSPMSDYLDIIILPGYEQVVLDDLAGYLRSTSGEWDFLDMENVSETSNAWRLVTRSLKTYGIPISKYSGTLCQQITLAPTYELFFQGLGPHVRDNLKRKFKKLQKEHAVEHEVFKHETDDIPSAVEAFAQIHSERWKSLGYPSAFDDRDNLQFHIDVAKKFARRGWLRLSFIKVDNRRVAVGFGFSFKRRVYLYQCNASGSEDVMRCSPGSLIKVLSIQEAISEGVTIYDFMRGDESYKSREWRTTITRNWLIRATSPRLTGKLRALLYLSYELLLKSKKQISREYYEFRRFRITNEGASASVVRYASNRIAALFRLGSHYILSHMPFRRAEGSPQEKGSVDA